MQSCKTPNQTNPRNHMGGGFVLGQCVAFTTDSRNPKQPKETLHKVPRTKGKPQANNNFRVKCTRFTPAPSTSPASPATHPASPTGCSFGWFQVGLGRQQGGLSGWRGVWVRIGVGWVWDRFIVGFARVGFGWFRDGVVQVGFGGFPVGTLLVRLGLVWLA